MVVSDPTFDDDNLEVVCALVKQPFHCETSFLFSRSILALIHPARLPFPASAQFVGSLGSSLIMDRLQLLLLLLHRFDILSTVFYQLSLSLSFLCV